jgi:hypothetical protein
MSDRLRARIRDFESLDGGANPSYSIMNNIVLNEINNDISNQKLTTILKLVEKKNTKRLIDLKSLIVQIMLAKRQSNVDYFDTTKGTYCVYYYNKIILSFLKLLKEQGYIFNYYTVPQNLLVTKLPVVIILFNYNLNL